MKYYGKINDPKDLVTAEYVDENGGKIDSIKVNGVTQPIAADKSVDVSAAVPQNFTWTDGTAQGPTGTLTGIGMNGVTFGAIPNASEQNSGVITTGDQNLSGIKTIYGDNSGLAFDREGSNNSLGFVMKENGNLALEIL